MLRMNDICRLCCSPKFLNNNIFDDENALFIKMSLCLPIKVFKNDRLPQKICDKCSCKVNDFYQFCNESIEVQNRLRAALVQSSAEPAQSLDLTYIDDVKINKHSPPPQHITTHRSTQTDHLPSLTCVNQGKTDTDASVKVKIEPVPLSPKVKLEVDQDYDSTHEAYIPSDDSDNLLLVDVKKKKRKSKKDKNVMNGLKRGRKRKLKELEEFVNVLSDGNPLKIEGIKSLSFEDGETEEVDLKELGVSVQQGEDKIKSEDAELFSCCICFLQCTGKYEMLKHYRQHRDASVCDLTPPAPPPAPLAAPLKCSRCNKKLEVDEWSGHWLRHWEMDHRPYRCSLCEQSFKDPITVFKHGLTHKEDSTKQEKRFICDLCPKGFFYMRFLLAHRTRAHAEAASLAYALRCGVCARAFTHINSLRRHMRAHSGERNFLCNVCGKSLSSKEHLKFHIRIHTGHKPYICKTCGKGFSKKHNLTLHERVHSGEKPHVCPHCGKAFSQRSTLVIHERYHSGARPYTCSLCGRGFVAKGLLSMHLKTTCI